VKRVKIDDLPGSERAKRFIGADHGATASLYVTSYHGRGRGPDLHRHPYDETFVMLEGSATFTVDGEQIEATAGEIVVVPANTPHKFKSTGDGMLRQVTIHPAERMEQEDLPE
jgi:mannose-6-phosphate isomerase-like protein (cupin superfamily)